MQRVLYDQRARALGDQRAHCLADEVGVVLGIEEGREHELARREVLALVLVAQPGHELVVEDPHLIDGAREPA